MEAINSAPNHALFFTTTTNKPSGTFLTATSLSLSSSLSLLPPKWLSRPSMSPTSLPLTTSPRTPLSPSAPPASPTVLTASSSSLLLFPFLVFLPNVLFIIFNAGVEMGRSGFKMPKFVVIGHRGNGMNVLQSSDRRMRAIKENTIMSFNAASTFPLDFIEFDVQVTLSVIFLFRFLHSMHFNVPPARTVFSSCASP